MSRGKTFTLIVAATLAAATLYVVHLQGMQGVIGANPSRYALFHILVLAGSIALTLLLRRTRGMFATVIVLGIMARILMFPLEPSDDVHRYLWEGKVQRAGMNPYVLAPDAPELTSLHDASWERINHKDKTAIYPPGFMLAMRVAVNFAETASQVKLLVVLADIATLWVLLALLRLLGRHPAWALLYALNPVVLSAFVGEGHLDAFMLLFTMSSLLFFYRKQWRCMFLFLGIAISVKYIAIVLLPFVIRRENIRHAWILPAVTLLPLLVFPPYERVFATLVSFSTGMDFNGSLHDLLARLFDRREIGALLSGVLFVLAVTTIRLATADPLAGGVWCMGALLALYPTVHFWYVSWLVPFLCFFPARSGLLFCATIVLSFASQGYAVEHGVWKEFHLLTLLEYLPVYLALLVDVRALQQPPCLADATPPPAVHTVSIIVPTLNEAEELPSLFDNLGSLHPQPLEIIVGDGGSSDGTAQLAEQHGVRVYASPTGRGCQVADASKHARGDILLVVHADMRLASDCLARILAALNKTGAPGGCIGCRFDRGGMILRLVNVLNDLRAGLFGLSFGDQGQFVRRTWLDETGGFPTLRIMEDVELSCRMKSAGRPVYLGGGVRASTRRWNRTSKARHALLVVGLVSRYLWLRARNGTVNDDAFYRAYYPSENGK